MPTAPIVVFAYNRPDHLARTLEALAVNDLAEQSLLYIYCDGPKTTASEHDLTNIASVRAVARSRQWCGEVHVIESPWNLGLADSIVKGVTETVARHGRVVVLEDDIVTQKGFLRFMNDALNLYENDDQVMHISGMIFGTPAVPDQSTAFLKILSCNGWATWQRAWKHYTHHIDTLIARLSSQNINPRQFDIDGGAHFHNQLIANKEGRLYTWAVRWYASWLTAGGISLFPTRSLVHNIGNDGSGTHSAADFYNGQTVEYLSVKRIPIEENTTLRQEQDEIWRKGRENLALLHRPGTKARLSSSARRQFEKIRSAVRRFSTLLLPELRSLDRKDSGFLLNASSVRSSVVLPNAKLLPPYKIYQTFVGNHSYISTNAFISYTRVGKFCSIGPNFMAGWGIHPTNGISTSPIFYSTAAQTGHTLSMTNKVQERLPITIGNDVFIGMNVTVLDGVTIGDGAVVGAGCVVSKDVPPYAVVVGCPMRIIRYRFPEETVRKLLAIRWWDWPDDKLPEIEEMFFDVERFVRKHYDEASGGALQGALQADKASSQ